MKIPPTPKRTWRAAPPTCSAASAPRLGRAPGTHPCPPRSAHPRRTPQAARRAPQRRRVRHELDAQRSAQDKSAAAHDAADELCGEPPPGLPTLARRESAVVAGDCAARLTLCASGVGEPPGAANPSAARGATPPAPPRYTDAKSHTNTHLLAGAGQHDERPAVDGGVASAGDAVHGAGARDRQQHGGAARQEACAHHARGVTRHGMSCERALRHRPPPPAQTQAAADCHCSAKQHHRCPAPTPSHAAHTAAVERKLPGTPLSQRPPWRTPPATASAHSSCCG